MNNNYQNTEQEEKNRIERKRKKGINSLGKALEGILKDVKEMQRSQEKVEEYKRIINISHYNYDYTYDHLKNPDGTSEWHLKSINGRSPYADTPYSKVIDGDK